MKGKTLILPLFLPTSLPSKKPWEVGSSEQTLMLFGGEKLDRGAGNATEQVTPAAHQQPQLHTENLKPHSEMIFLKSQPEIAEKGQTHL